MKSLCHFRSTLYCPLADQKLLEKQAFWLKSINKAYIIIIACVQKSPIFFVARGKGTFSAGGCLEWKKRKAKGGDKPIASPTS